MINTKKIFFFFNADKLYKTIEELKIKNNGGKRLIIVYLSIGEAEDYRFYWNKKKPNWIVKENENWEGNCIVKYWSPEWKNIIKEYQKKLYEDSIQNNKDSIKNEQIKLISSEVSDIDKIIRETNKIIRRVEKQIKNIGENDF